MPLFKIEHTLNKSEGRKVKIEDVKKAINVEEVLVGDNNG